MKNRQSYLTSSRFYLRQKKPNSLTSYVDSNKLYEEAFENMLALKKRNQ